MNNRRNRFNPVERSALSELCEMFSKRSRDRTASDFEDFSRAVFNYSPFAYSSFWSAARSSFGKDSVWLWLIMKYCS